jgi:hypothetical protein
VTEFLSALAGTKSGTRFRTHLADLPGELERDRQCWPVRVSRLTGGSVTVDVEPRANPGDRFTLRIEGVSRPLLARFAGPAEPGSHLQLPMDLDHVEWFEGEIRRLGLAAAA